MACLVRPERPLIGAFRPTNPRRANPGHKVSRREPDGWLGHAEPVPGSASPRSTMPLDCRRWWCMAFAPRRSNIEIAGIATIVISVALLAVLLFSVW